MQELYAVNIKRENSGFVSTTSSSLVGSFPLADLGNFKYSPQAEALVFSTYVWPNGDSKLAGLTDLTIHS